MLIEKENIEGLDDPKELPSHEASQGGISEKIIVSNQMVKKL
jgi:hypothetical protein